MQEKKKSNVLNIGIKWVGNKIYCDRKECVHLIIAECHAGRSRESSNGAIPIQIPIPGNQWRVVWGFLGFLMQWKKKQQTNKQIQPTMTKPKQVMEEHVNFSWKIHISVYHLVSQDRNSSRVGIWGQGLKQRLWLSMLTGFLLLACSGCFVLAHQTTFPPTVSWPLLYQSLINKTYLRLAQRPGWYGHFLNWNSLIPKSSDLWQDDLKLTVFGALCSGLEGVALMEEVCHCGWPFKFQLHLNLQIAFCFKLVIQDLSELFASRSRQEERTWSSSFMSRDELVGEYQWPKRNTLGQESCRSRN